MGRLTPKALAIHSEVISSWVGPIPPLVKTKVYFFLISLIHSIIFSFTSGIILTSFTVTPTVSNFWAKYLEFNSWVRPDKISLPIIIMPDVLSDIFFIYKSYTYIITFQWYYKLLLQEL